ncbi:MAG: hypothetical protein D3923_14265, partial [Candidatus Electrothrix sp. AR3]|nr:hypothetical protein [Candidatus Electrothrix sp. AR3]
TAPADLTLHAEQVLDASRILSNRYNLSRRNITKNAVRWSPEPWGVEGEQTRSQQTPDLSSLIREVTAQPGWLAGNAMMFLLTGNGYQVVRSLDGADEYSDVPRLYIEYSEDDQ